MESGQVDSSETGGNMAPPRLTSERLELGPLSETDAPGLFRYRAAPEVYRYQSWVPADEGAALEFIRKVRATVFGARDSWYQLGVREPRCPDLIGDVGLHFHAEDASQVEIGFTIAPWMQGRGLATHAVDLILNYLFGELGIRRVSASVDPRNLASVAVLTRLGFVRESFHPKSFRLRGEWVDDAVYVYSGSVDEPQPE